MATVSGSLTAAGNTVEIDVNQAARVTAYLSGSSFTASLSFEGSDGTNWSDLGFTLGSASQQNSVVSVSLSNTNMPRTYHLDRPGVVKARIRAVSITGQIDVRMDTYGIASASAESGGTDTVDAVRIQGETQQSFAISGTGAQASGGVASTGVYDFSSDVDCFLKISPSAGTASDVTTSTGEPLYAGNVVPHYLAANDRPGAITSGATGTLRYIRTHP